MTALYVSIYVSLQKGDITFHIIHNNIHTTALTSFWYLSKTCVIFAITFNRYT